MQPMATVEIKLEDGWWEKWEMWEKGWRRGRGEEEKRRRTRRLKERKKRRWQYLCFLNKSLQFGLECCGFGIILGRHCIGVSGGTDSGVTYNTRDTQPDTMWTKQRTLAPAAHCFKKAEATFNWVKSQLAVAAWSNPIAAGFFRCRRASDDWSRKPFVEALLCCTAPRRDFTQIFKRSLANCNRLLCSDAPLFYATGFNSRSSSFFLSPPPPLRLCPPSNLRRHIWLSSCHRKLWSKTKLKWNYRPFSSRRLIETRFVSIQSGSKTSPHFPTSNLHVSTNSKGSNSRRLSSSKLHSSRPTSSRKHNILNQIKTHRALIKNYIQPHLDRAVWGGYH